MSLCIILEIFLSRQHIIFISILLDLWLNIYLKIRTVQNSKINILFPELLIRDFRVRFRRTFLSIIWLLLPLITLTGAAVFLSLRFSTLTEFSIGQYLINLLIGLMLWQLMADAWLEPMGFA